MKPDGGPAFPRISGVKLADRERWESDGGMTLRDYFAARAPAPTEQWIEDSLGDGKDLLEATAAWSYRYADEMLKVREA